MAHTIITGNTDRGKTNGAIRLQLRNYEKFKMNIIGINNKRGSNDWNVLYKYYPNDTNIFCLGLENGYTLYINPLYIPEGIKAEQWAETVAESICKTMGNLTERSLFKIKKAILFIYKEKGVLSNQTHQLR